MYLQIKISILVLAEESGDVAGTSFCVAGVTKWVGEMEC